jgi:hypothetical protein
MTIARGGGSGGRAGCRGGGRGRFGLPHVNVVESKSRRMQ